MCPLDLEEANALVRTLHRHHVPVVGHKFSLGAVSDKTDSNGVSVRHIVGAVIVGRPEPSALGVMGAKSPN